MKLYLSSYGLGNDPQRLVNLLPRDSPKAAVSVNALDFLSPGERDYRLKGELTALRELGIEASEIDLRDYFEENRQVLSNQLDDVDLVWFSGGNAFVLLRAMTYSGFSEIAIPKIKDDTLAYGGYSAAFCVASSTLRGVELIDSPDVVPACYGHEIVWDGLALIDFYPVVHYQSDHPESEQAQEQFEFAQTNGFDPRPFKDGEFWVVEDRAS